SAKLLLRGRVVAPVGMAHGEHRPGPARLLRVADRVGEAARPSEGRLSRAISSLDRRDPAALALDLSNRRAIAELVRDAKRPLQMTRPFARRAESASGICRRAEDQRTSFERPVSALGRLAGRAERDVTRARELAGLETHLRDVEQRA